MDGNEEFGPTLNADSEMVLLTEVTSYSGKAGGKREALPGSGFDPRGRRRYGSAVPVVAPKPVEGGGGRRTYASLYGSVRRKPGGEGSSRCVQVHGQNKTWMFL